MAFAMCEPGAAMPDLKTSIADRIRAKLDAGDLPRLGPKKMWGGFGKNNACDGCGNPILTTDIEYEFNLGDKRTCRFHISCAGIWQAELRRRGWVHGNGAPPRGRSLPGKETT
jgi:hypothetical protein